MAERIQQTLGQLCGKVAERGGPEAMTGWSLGDSDWFVKCVSIRGSILPPREGMMKLSGKSAPKLIMPVGCCQHSGVTLAYRNHEAYLLHQAPALFNGR